MKELIATITVLLVVLKLAGLIHWSWWAVTALVWAPLSVLIAAAVMVHIAGKASQIRL